jgi:hypothetical protein
MPCFSTVTRTKMTDAERVEKALTALGYENIRADGLQVSGYLNGGKLVFDRYRADQAFETRETNRDAINSIQRKYSEIGVRAWAKQNGFDVALNENKGRKLTLINRRG